MKLVILDHPDWMALKRQNKVIPVLDAGKCALALHKHPETRHWKPALAAFTALVPLGAIAGVVRFFFIWWAGLILLFFSLVPLRSGIARSVEQEVLRVAEVNTSFFSCAIAVGALRFRVKEEDLRDIQYLDGTRDVPSFMPPLD